MNVNLDDREWQAVMQILANQPWHVANPLLMKIGEQLRTQQMPDTYDKQKSVSGNSGEKHAQ